MSVAKQKKAILVNYTKKQFVRYDECVLNNVGWILNPLPLLTALGNGKGGGDYFDNSPDFDKVGIWAGDSIGIRFAEPKSFEKIRVLFKDEI